MSPARGSLALAVLALFAGQATAMELRPGPAANSTVSAGSIDTTKLATDSVTSTAIKAGSVDSSKLASGIALPGGGSSIGPFSVIGTGAFLGFGYQGGISIKDSGGNVRSVLYRQDANETRLVSDNNADNNAYLSFRTGNSSVEKMRIDQNGLVSVGPVVFTSTTNFGVGGSQGNISANGSVQLGGTLIVSTTASPASGAACTAGSIAWDASYIYVCTASAAWKRSALTGGY